MLKKLNSTDSRINFPDCHVHLPKKQLKAYTCTRHEREVNKLLCVQKWLCINCMDHLGMHKFFRKSYILVLGNINFKIYNHIKGRQQDATGSHKVNGRLQDASGFSKTTASNSLQLKQSGGDSNDKENEDEDSTLKKKDFKCIRGLFCLC